jgi:glycine cleavage system H protein
MRPDNRRYTKSHEWAKLDGETVLVGITDFAVNELCSGNEGDLVYCDLPEPGRVLDSGETFGEIESVKAVADLNAPIAGTVVEVNTAIQEHLEILSRDPWNEGWMVRIKPNVKSLDGLLSAEDYEASLAEAEKH